MKLRWGSNPKKNLLRFGHCPRGEGGGLTRIQIVQDTFKLDRVGPIDNKNRPSTDKLQHLVQKKKKKKMTRGT